jgi:hypothetical protein
MYYGFDSIISFAGHKHKLLEHKLMKDFRIPDGLAPEVLYLCINLGYSLKAYLQVIDCGTGLRAALQTI